VHVMHLPVLGKFWRDHTDRDRIISEAVRHYRAVQKPVAENAGADSWIALLVEAPTAQRMKTHPEGCS
jgi:hypothetical protein